ncbi:xanthine dehydrogenase family protein subunit M [Bradyrhizobium sp. BRP56]|uniref:FAD binding domain-containing protein n=1 Tax=Bradyrhizobium sp. BRP56 TaxID=2793819 RepID=UPI001CD37D7D|nr:xanthine dehydrogenase family protein subunit M [Bradyrhizobium sp. BRP56]MCA1396233.1 xanthine dehydrogenase family protein subunit M [Bradyrhizobium sp. BRP56]
MKPPAFEYAAPSTLAEAVSLLASRNGNAKVISGGQSLMPMLAYRLAAPELLVDLRHLKDLAAIRIEADGVRLGAKVRWCDIENDRRLAVSHPLLAEAIKHVAHYQIRNRGTVGGSVAHADPSAEMPGVALTCDARMTIVGPAGTRVEAAADFFTGPLETSLEPDEILTEVHLPAWPAERRWAFLEFARRKGDFAIAGVALHYDLDGGGRITDAHIGAIGIADRPIRLAEAEAVLNGNQVTDKLIAMASAKARQTVDPPSDIHAPGAYRAALVATLLSRGLKKSAV